LSASNEPRFSRVPVISVGIVATGGRIYLNAAIMGVHNLAGNRNSKGRPLRRENRPEAFAIKASDKTLAISLNAPDWNTEGPPKSQIPLCS
jgi:hypothetical protein